MPASRDHLCLQPAVPVLPLQPAQPVRADRGHRLPQVSPGLLPQLLHILGDAEPGEKPSVGRGQALGGGRGFGV